jgi:nucleoside 2-deoxyribosyltransferase
MTRRQNLYFAAPLFSFAERQFNANLATALEEHCHVFLPQRDGRIFVDLTAQGMAIDEAAREIFYRDTSAIRACDIFLIVLDGRSVDEGAAFELGLAYALGKVCVGLQTDARRLLPVGNNPMVDCALCHMCETPDALTAWVGKWVASLHPHHSRR